jgi:putative spermidine/putrescine transport system substrate-binding protein
MSMRANLKAGRVYAALLTGAALAFGLAACGKPAATPAADAGPAMITELGANEGVLNIVAWEGYAEDQWVKPFEKDSGCIVNRKYAGSSDEMVALMRQGGEYDLVSASGDASMRLIRGGSVQPVNTALIPDFAKFIPELQSPTHNTVDGKHYGISYMWGPNVLMWDTRAIKAAPTSWAALYDAKYKGKITVPDNPIQIADAALYLSKTKPELGITDPYELTQPQMDAVVALLKTQRPLIKKYWALASDEISLFSSRDASIGAAWPYQVIALQDAKVPVDSTVPSEGATGWADTWMLSTTTKHPNCAYKFMAWVSTPVVQAQQALFFGATPVNKDACAEMDKTTKGSCTKYHADAAADYFSKIHFWKTPEAACGNGQTNCLDYTAWQTAWQSVKQ